ncbi:MAG: T9SS type A sorting domain-containing protein [Bacteroidota bacterium]
MKTALLSATLILTSLISFSQSIECPTSLKRNNGNGTCTQGQLQLFYTGCPAEAPVIDSVYVSGVKYPVTFDVPNDSKCESRGYLSYCVISGNMPPAHTWLIYFRTSTLSATCVVTDANSGPLPVTMNNFTTKRLGNSILLNWNTQTEINSLRFEIERKTANDNDYITVGSVTAENKTTGSNYSYTDNNNSQLATTYRLKMIDKNGSFYYSTITAVNGTSAINEFSIYPNPSIGNAKITLTGVYASVKLQVIDNAGRTIKAMELNRTNTVQLNDLQRGVYLVRMVNNSTGEVITKKLSVTK